MRWLPISLALAAAVGAGIGAPGTAMADPSGGGIGQCTWKPVPPSVVVISGVKRVTARLDLGPCTVIGNQNMSTVCLLIQGDGTPPDCDQQTTSNPAQVYSRYMPGATYVYTARGCVDMLSGPVTPLCQTFGPDHYTL